MIAFYFKQNPELQMKKLPEMSDVKKPHFMGQPAVAHIYIHHN